MVDHPQSVLHLQLLKLLQCSCDGTRCQWQATAGQHAQPRWAQSSCVRTPCFSASDGPCRPETRFCMERALLVPSTNHCPAFFLASLHFHKQQQNQHSCGSEREREIRPTSQVIPVGAPALSSPVLVTKMYTQPFSGPPLPLAGGRLHPGACVCGEGAAPPLLSSLTPPFGEALIRQLAPPSLARVRAQPEIWWQRASVSVSDPPR